MTAKEKYLIELKRVIESRKEKFPESTVEGLLTGCVQKNNLTEILTSVSECIKDKSDIFGRWLLEEAIKEYYKLTGDKAVFNWLALVNE